MGNLSQQFFQVFSWISHRLRAGGKHGMHAPEMYRWYDLVCFSRRRFYGFDKLSALRFELLQNSTQLEVVDFGAGSSMGNSRQRRISEIARHSLKSPESAERLFRMCELARPSLILELGTSLGLTTAYLAMACKNAVVHTLEGSPELCKVAKQNWEHLGLSNIKCHCGTFEELLTPLLKDLSGIDFVFVDGNHRKKATLEYFECLLPKMSETGIIVFDDIHWSSGMKEAWDQIRKRPEVRVSVTFYDMGVVFLHPEWQEGHYLLKG